MTKIKNYQTFHTTKLFHKKYPYKVAISKMSKSPIKIDNVGWSIDNCKDWFSNSKITDFRLYNKIRVLYNGALYISGRFSKKEINRSKLFLTASIFLKTKSDFNAFIKKYEADIDSVTVPINNNHISVLESDRSIVVRKTLLYKKYRYVVKFKFKYRHGVTNDVINVTIADWIEENFLTVNTDCKWDNYGRNLYFNGEDNLMLIKLSQGDEIKTITEIRTFDEIKSIQ